MTFFLIMLLKIDLDLADPMSSVSSNMDVGTGESSKLKIFSTFRAWLVSWSEITLEYMSDMSISSTSLTFKITSLSSFIMDTAAEKIIRQIDYKLLQLLFSYSFPRFHTYFFGWELSYKHVDYFLRVAIYMWLDNHDLTISAIYSHSCLGFLLMVGYIVVCLIFSKSKKTLDTENLQDTFPAL